jgi:NAD(P)-dependent dehydrogenase (short-subunit alcohol dehydrogenase family)
MVAVAGKVVVITGGRRGLGAALVDEVIARGARKVYSTATPADVAKQIVEGLESGAVEVLADDLTVNVKAALSGPVENLTFSLPN